MTEQTGFVAGWGTASLVNAGLAQGKRRSGLNWWLVSLLLGPVATLLIVALDPPDRKEETGRQGPAPSRGSAGQLTI